MRGRKDKSAGSTLIEVLIALLLSAILVTIIFNFDSGIRRTLLDKLSDSHDYTALMLLRQRISRDVRNSDLLVLSSDSLFEMHSELSRTVTYRITQGLIYRNGVLHHLGNFVVNEFLIAQNNNRISPREGILNDSLLYIRVVNTRSDTIELRLPLKPVSQLTIHRR